MSAQTKGVDVLAILDVEIDAFRKTEAIIGVAVPDRRLAYEEHLAALIEARAAVAELIEAAEKILRDAKFNGLDWVISDADAVAVNAALARCGGA